MEIESIGNISICLFFSNNYEYFYFIIYQNFIIDVLKISYNRNSETIKIKVFLNVLCYIKFYCFSLHIHWNFQHLAMNDNMILCFDDLETTGTQNLCQTHGRRIISFVLEYSVFLI